MSLVDPWAPVPVLSPTRHPAGTRARRRRSQPARQRLIADGHVAGHGPLALGELRLNALILELALYPDIEVELILNDRFVDLVEEGVDVAGPPGRPRRTSARRRTRRPRVTQSWRC
ncbi:MAG: hypothetical protein H0X13_12300 [Ramlibacter sp.]|nr:hypothetical protein [Ramlibacter sp.]